MPKGYPSLEPRRNPGRAKRVFLEANGDAPWACGYCGGPVYEMGHGGLNGLIHHVDEDPTNDVPKNLVMMHDLCHMRHHKGGKVGNRKGAVVTAETRERISNALKGKPAAHGYTAEVRAKIGAAARGRPFTEKKFTCECGKITHAGPMAIHQRAKGHKMMQEDSV